MGCRLRNAGTGANNYGILYNNSAATSSAAPLGQPGRRTRMEPLRHGSVGNATGGQSLDRGAETTARQHDGLALGPAYGTTIFALGLTLRAPLAIRSFKDVLGPRSMVLRSY